MKLTKLLSLTLFATCLLAGCSSNSQNNSQNSNSDIYTEVGTYPIVKEGESTSFSVFAPLRPSVTTYDANTNPFTAYMEDLTGVTLDFTEVTSSDSKQKFNVMMTSGEYTDVILDMSLGLSELLLYGQQGIFLPLNDLIDQYAPNIKKALEENPIVKNTWTLEDGNLYVVPRIGSAAHSQTSYRMWLNQEWLDNLNLAVPKTTEEFYQVLKAFKEKDANGNGDPNDEIPLSGSIKAWNGDPMPFILNAFIPASPTTGYINIDENGKLYYVKSTDEFKEYLKYMNKLYSEGLLDEFIFSQGKDELLKLGSNPEIAILGATGGGSASVISNIANVDRWTQYIALPPLEGPTGLRSAANSPNYGMSSMVITNKCENPEAVMRYFDYMYTVDGRIFNTLGFLDEGRYILAPEGSINLINEPAKYTRLSGDQITDLSWNSMGPLYNWEGYELEFTVTQPAEHDIEYVLYNSAVNDYIPVAQDEATMLPKLAYNTDESRLIVDVVTNLNLYVDQAVAAFVTGQEDIESGWADYLAQLEKLGLSDYIAVNQSAYDRKMDSLK
ncbi:MAG: hypothetical protein ATN31_06225 [Candidatus Epulonipiscioides saccharophilum]|nr:MAG: hypothetical protein ATN31_06225 [Epulopiscium sp. AS2M-Bin001]